MTGTGDVTNAELARAVARIEAHIGRVTKDHELRLRRLERAVWIATGTGAAAVSSSIAILTGVTLP